MHRLRKGVSKLFSKGMSDIYLKVTTEIFSKLLFCEFKNLPTGLFWGAPTHADIIEFYNFLLQLKIQTSGSKTVCCLLFCYFNFERCYDVLKPKSPCILFNKNINFNKNKTESKMENPTGIFRETNLVLELIYKSQIKSNTVMG